MNIVRYDTQILFFNFSLRKKLYIVDSETNKNPNVLHPN